MAAKGTAHRRRVHLHVVHRLQDVAHQADARAAEVVEDACDRAPLANFIGGGSNGQDARCPSQIGHATGTTDVLSVGCNGQDARCPSEFAELADDDVGDGAAVADGDAGELGDGAKVVVVELLVDRRVLVVEARVWLERDEHDRAGKLPHERRERRACGIRHHVDEEQVEVGGLHRRNERRRLLRVVGDAEAVDLEGGRARVLTRRGGRGRPPFQRPHERVFLLLHVVVEAGALLPVRVEADRHHADVRRERLAALDTRRGINRRGGLGTARPTISGEECRQNKCHTQKIISHSHRLVPYFTQRRV